MDYIAIPSKALFDRQLLPITFRLLCALVHQSNPLRDPVAGSCEGGRVGVIPSTAIFDLRLSPLSFRVLCAIAQSDPQTGFSLSVRRQLAESLGIRPATFSKHLGVLKKLGYLSVETVVRIQRADRGDGQPTSPACPAPPLPAGTDAPVAPTNPGRRDPRLH